jgi:hypothetical protein
MQIVGNVTGFALGSFAAIAGNLPLALVAVALIELVGEQREALAVEQRIDRVGCDPTGGTEDVGPARLCPSSDSYTIDTVVDAGPAARRWRVKRVIAPPA